MPVRKATFGLCVALACSIMYLTIHYVTNSIYYEVKQQYMDEEFHIPQAQRYCEGNFTYYDPKLTTPPGLYILSYIRIYVRDKVILQKPSLNCGVVDLRRSNHSFTISSLIVVVLILLTSNSKVNLIRKYVVRRKIAQSFDKSTTLDLAKLLLTAVAIITHPPLFFFNSLYYTDVGSVHFTLLAYFFAINDHHLLSCLLGVCSLFFRQTNIVWLFYTAGIVFIRTIEEHQQANNSAKKDEKTKKSIANHDNRNHCYLNCIRDNKQLVLDLVKRCIPYACVGMGFIGFLVINKGIVLGDKDAHQPKFHGAQILYFLGYCAIFGSSWIFHMRLIRRFLYFMVRSPVMAALASALIIHLIAFGRYAHPYLLADNRHLVTYVWRRILDRHNSYVPYLLTPLYLLSSLSIWHHLRSRGCKHILLFVFCAILVTVPNGLLEPRYFIMPFIFLRLNVDNSPVGLVLELGQNLAINVVMHYIFLYRTFYWADGSLQRIMW